MRPLHFLFLILLMQTTISLAQPDSLWSRTYGGEGFDRFSSLVPSLHDDGFVLAGYTRSFGAGEEDFWMIKTNSEFDSLWSQTYGSEGHEYCNSAAQTSVGGYLLVGERRDFPISNMMAVKLTSLGTVSWSREYDLTIEAEYCFDVVQNNHHLLAGVASSFNNDDIILANLSIGGDTTWTRHIVSEDNEDCRSVINSNEGGCMICGFAWPHGGLSDLLLTKVTGSGDVFWSSTYGGDGMDTGVNVVQTQDQNYVAVGSTNSFGSGSYDFWVIKVNTQGDSLWSRTYGGSESDEATAVLELPDGGLLVGGTTRSFGAGNVDFWLLRIDEDGDSLWSRTFGGPENDYLYKIHQADDGGFILAGNTASYGAGGTDFWIVKTGPDPTVDVNEKPTLIPTELSIAAYPNPFNSELTLNITGFIRDVRISMFDLLGREVTIIHDGLLTTNSLHYTAPASLSSGLYFLRANDINHTFTTKIIYLK